MTARTLYRRIVDDHTVRVLSGPAELVFSGTMKLL